MDGFSKLSGSSNPENVDYAAGFAEDNKILNKNYSVNLSNVDVNNLCSVNKQPSVIEQITAIIDKGGPKEVKYDSMEDKTFLSDKEIPSLTVYYHHSIIEDECERFNSEYVAKAILKCLQKIPLNFNSVYDRMVWTNTIERLMK